MLAKGKIPPRKKAAKKEPPAPEIVVLRDEVSQANPLIQAKRNFTTIGTRIFFLGLRALNPHFSEKDKFFDEKFPRVTIPPAQLTEIFGGNTVYLHELKRECERLFNAIIEFTAADGGFTLNHIFRELKYVPREGLHIEFDDVMRPYLLELLKANGYTVISVAQIFQLSSTYAVRLVEIMLQYQNIAPMRERKVIERKMAMAELRFALNVKKGAYADRINNFRKAVLDGPISEINARTVYRMRYEVVRDGKRGGRVIGFVLYMDVSAVKGDKPLIGAETAIEKLRGLGFSAKAAEAILAKCGSEAECQKRIAVATLSLASKKRQGGVESELGYLRACIEEDWTPRSKTAVKSAKQPPPTAEVLPETPEAASLARCAPRRGASKPSRVLPPLGEGKTRPEPSEGEFRAGEVPLPPNLRDLVVGAAAQARMSESLKLFLEPFGLTIERFRELYM